MVQGPEVKKQKFAVDAVHYTEELREMFQKWSPSVIYVLEGVNPDR